MSSLKKNLNLFWVLSRMHLRTSDYRSLLGAMWSFAGPLLTFAVLYFIFVDRFGQHISSFSLKLFVGIFVLNFFLNVIQLTMHAFVCSRDIVINSLTPSEILLTAPLSVPVYKFTVEMGLCMAIGLFQGKFAPADLGWVLGLMAALLFMGWGLGLILAVLNSMASDVGEIWQRISPLLFFVTPIFYYLNMLSPWGGFAVYWLNPLTPFVLSFQEKLGGGGVPCWSPFTLWQALFLALAFSAGGYRYFKRYEKRLMEGG